MTHIFFRLSFAILGTASAAFGGALLFSDKFLDHLYKTIWKSTALDAALFSPKGRYQYDRFGRGSAYLLFGLGMIWLATQ